MDDDYSAQEFLRFFVVAWLSSLAFIVARVTGWLAKSPVQPVEPEMLREWRARRWWVVWAEISASPAMGLVSAVATILSGNNVLVAAAGGLVVGAVGFPFLVGGIRELVRRRLNLGDGDGDVSS